MKWILGYCNCDHYFRSDSSAVKISQKVVFIIIISSKKHWFESFKKKIFVHYLHKTNTINQYNNRHSYLYRYIYFNINISIKRDRVLQEQA